MHMADCLHKVLSRTTSYIILGSIAIHDVLDVSVLDIKPGLEFSSVILLKYADNCYQNPYCAADQ